MATLLRKLQKIVAGEHKFGHNGGVGQNSETLWTTGGLYPWSSTWDTGASEIFIQSSSAQDAPGGTGISVVQVAGIAGDGTFKSTNVTMSGTFTVSSGTWSCIFRMSGVSCGTSDTNVGAITALYGATTVATIAAGDGQTEMAIYQVPVGYAGYIIRIWASCQSGDTADIGLYTRAGHGAPWRLRSHFHIDSGAIIENVIPPGLVNINAGDQVELRAVGSNASGSEVDGGFDMLFGTETV